MTSAPFVSAGGSGMSVLCILRDGLRHLVARLRGAPAMYSCPVDRHAAVRVGAEVDRFRLEDSALSTPRPRGACLQPSLSLVARARVPVRNEAGAGMARSPLC